MKFINELVYLMDITYILKVSKTLKFKSLSFIKLYYEKWRWVSLWYTMEVKSLCAGVHMLHQRGCMNSLTLGQFETIQEVLVYAKNKYGYFLSLSLCQCCCSLND